MLIPSKFTTLEESTIFKMRVILEKKPESESLSDLLKRTSGQFIDTSEFLHALDILFVLNLIEIDSSGIVKYAA